MASRDTPEAFCIRLELDDPRTSERASAEAWQAGALGIEERERASGGTVLLLYAAPDAVAAVAKAVEALPGARVTDTEAVVATDWSQAWRDGLDAIEIGTRLVVRPSWIDFDPAPGQAQVVIDPGQAFGTGAHVSTRLVLEWIEAAAGEGAFDEAIRVLDVGVGTGVLAMAALKLGAGRAVGFDLDPLAGEATREWAARNGVADRLDAFIGGIDALRGRFDWLLVNLLKREMLPIAHALADATKPGGHAVFSGLLARERDEVEHALAAVDFADARTRAAVDANGDEWISLLMTRGS